MNNDYFSKHKTLQSRSNDDAAIQLLADKLKENDATFKDILAISALVPSLVPLVKAITKDISVQ